MDYSFEVRNRLAKYGYLKIAKPAPDLISASIENDVTRYMDGDETDL